MSGFSSMGTAAGLLGIVRRSLRQHLLSTCVTALSLALASGLVMAVFAIQDQAHRAFTGGQTGFDAVVGAKGSPLQLVLNTVFHLETSPGNIPWSVYQELEADPRIEIAIPYAVGDHYDGFRIVGTTERIFEDFEYRKGQRFELTAPHRPFDVGLREAVIGSTVARETGLRRGSKFHPSHGFSETPDGHHHHEDYVVVGVLAPTNSPSDRVIWIPLEGIFRLDGHELRGTGDVYVPQPGVEIPEEHREVSAVMLKLKGGPQTGFQLGGKYNQRGTGVTFAYPIAQVMTTLFAKMGWMSRVLLLVAYLVVAVAVGSVLASVYNTMNERRREFALLRALGARRGTVFSVIVLESGTIAALGALLGFAVYGGILAIAATIVRDQTGVVLDLTDVHPALIWTPIAMPLLGALTGVVPAVKAYRTDVATHLIPAS